MAKISVLFEHFEDELKPFSMIIRFKKGEMNWDKILINIPITTPFQRFLASEFTDGVLSAAIHLDDLTVNADKPGTFGIHIPTLKNRCEVQTELDEIEQLIVRICDIEDVLQMDLQRTYAWGE